ncbi:alpha-galactosidase [Sedimentisphaera salicampi]|uniref:Alpha-galactosidase n=1 Tax=Sedimentisphaera salicampi TaxID=1941349 RepID=A0A1W6LQG1_9BACT|nr:alpha-galactosidase [Sedimentisphaera salicampi]ARN57996.1 Alpha-galactosidase [Sedimentisphaera salicampi]
MRFINQFSAALLITYLCVGLSAYAEEMNKTYLSDLNTEFVVQGWGNPGVDQSLQDDSPLSIKGREFEKGIATHAVSYISIDLKKDARRFHAFVGIDDSSGDKGSSAFVVKGDGRTLYKSGVIKGGEKAEELNIDVEGINTLTLHVTDGGDEFYNDHADWADAWIEYKTQKPEMIPYRADRLYGISGWEGSSDYKIAKPVKLPFVKPFEGDITDYVILTFTSTWGDEYRIQTERLSEQGFSHLEKSGQSCGTMKPFVMLLNTKTKEGFAVFLAYSGNWSMEIKQPTDSPVKLTVESSPGCLPELASVSGLPIPGALISEFKGHWDYGTLPIRRFIRKNLLRDLGDNWPVVQYNEYFDNKGNFNEQNLLEKAEIAASLGCELFVIDAGWYGSNHPWRNSIGDWFVNKDKLPNGLEPVAEAVRDMGMKFGVWVSMECISKNSELIRKHPDWVMIDRRIVEEPVPADPRDWKIADLDEYWHDVGPIINLNLGKADALKHQKKVIEWLMNSYDLDYIKMDFNVASSTGSELYSGKQDPLYGHYEGLIELWQFMRNNYPDLVIENCSSGSKRADVMTSAFTDTHWSSDEVDNLANLAINFGSTYLFPPEMCSDWTTYPEDKEHMDVLDVPSRFTVNMMGHFGLSGEIEQWSSSTKDTARERIEYFKKYRHIIRNSEVYHLTSQIDVNNPNSSVAVQFADKTNDKSMVFAYQGNAPEMKKTIRLRTLSPQKEYKVSMPESLGGKTLKIKGEKLLEEGLQLKFAEKGCSGIIQIKRNY